MAAMTSTFRIPRAALLLLLAGIIVGWGCVTIPIPAPKEETATKIWLPAAQKGDAMAAFKLALAYEKGSAGLTSDHAQAMRWLQQAAQGGIESAQMLLADIYLQGLWGQDRRPQKGQDILEQLAAHSPAAQMQLADLFAQGRWLPQDRARAMTLYEQAARQGYRFAAWKLARMQADDPASRVDAYAWFMVGNGPDEAQRVWQQLRPDQQPLARQRADNLRRELSK